MDEEPVRDLTCDICGERRAAFICSRCGRKVCHNCFDASSWLCVKCLNELGGARAIKPLPTWPFVLALILMVVGSVLMVVGALLSPPYSTIFVWPPLFIVGPSLTALVLAVIAMALFAIAIILLVYAMIRYLVMAFAI